MLLPLPGYSPDSPRSGACATRAVSSHSTVRCHLNQFVVATFTAKPRYSEEMHIAGKVLEFYAVCSRTDTVLIYNKYEEIPSF